MKRIIAALLILLPAAAFAAASISFERESHDFGEAKQGELLEHSFEFTNTGTDDLVIEKLESS